MEEISRVVDDISNDSSIDDVFVQSYKESYTSVPCNKLNILHIIEENHDCVRRCGYNKDCLSLLLTLRLQ